MMNRRQVRRLIAAVSSAVLAWSFLRRRLALFQTLPEFVEERIELPIGGRSDLAEPEDNPEEDQINGQRMTRKVGRNRKISVGGKLYGPLDQALIGQQVEVEERNGRIVVWSGPAEVGSFEQQP